jgi:putative NADPH-quinone reductase
VTKNIVVIQGHPDPHGQHYCHALAQAYVEGAKSGGHLVRTIDIAHLEFPLLRSAEQYRDNLAPADIFEAQEKINWASHIVIVYPLWLGSVPALLKAFLEQTFREDFAMISRDGSARCVRLLKGKSARLVVSMGMPVLLYRLYFGAYGLKNLERSVLHFAGISPVRETLIGNVERRDSVYRGRWLLKVQRLGYDAR